MIAECKYCKSSQANMFSPQLFNGFYDADLKIFVCWDCRKKHYREKEKTEFRYRYSEMPVVLKMIKNLK